MRHLFNPHATQGKDTVTLPNVFRNLCSAINTSLKLREMENTVHGGIKQVSMNVADIVSDVTCFGAILKGYPLT